jgi:5'-3' exonuclease
MDMNGNGQLIHKEKIISITQFDSPDNFERFRWMCIMSGCDYLENLPGVGLGKAKKLLKTIKKTEIEDVREILKLTNVSINYLESNLLYKKTTRF